MNLNFFLFIYNFNLFDHHKTGYITIGQFVISHEFLVMMVCTHLFPVTCDTKTSHFRTHVFLAHTITLMQIFLLLLFVLFSGFLVIEVFIVRVEPENFVRHICFFFDLSSSPFTWV